MSVLELFVSTKHIYVILKAYSLQSEYQGYQTNLLCILPDLDAKVKNNLSNLLILSAHHCYLLTVATVVKTISCHSVWL